MAFVTLLLVACITFFLMNAIPGNPWLSEKTPSEATIQALNAKYGLDQPKYIQLGKYLKNLAQGDFGTSIKMQKNRPVIEIIKEMFPVSAKVGSLALLWAVIVGVPLGCLAAFKRGTWVDSFLRVLCTIGISMPGFVVATLLLHTLCGGIEGVKVFRHCLMEHRQVMYCRVRHLDSIRCVICPDRLERPCSTPSIRNISRQQEQKV